MSYGQGFDAKEQVRQAIDIVDLVGSYVQLRRQGRNFVGTCPWHDDSRPSLQVNPDRQSFKCWVCDYGGDVFSFVMRTENMEFREALELLAERAGINLTPPQAQHGEYGGSQERVDPSSDKRVLYRVAAWAEEEFHRCSLSNGRSGKERPGGVSAWPCRLQEVIVLTVADRRGIVVFIVFEGLDAPNMTLHRPRTLHHRLALLEV